MNKPEKPEQARPPAPKPPRDGIIGPLVAFLDRNLLRFSRPVRDTIGVGFLFIIVAYTLNGLIGSTYVRGELWLHRAGEKHRGEGWQVSSGENQAIVNHSGFWTLPVYGNGIPGVIRLIVDDDGRDEKGEHRQPRTIGEVRAFGPWPVWNTFKPMSGLVIDVYADRSPEKQLMLTQNRVALPFQVESVYAQSTATPPSGGTAGALPTVVTRPSLPCALALKQISVTHFPGFFRSSGRAYFELTVDGKRISDDRVLYGPGLGPLFGQFPVRNHKELWLPVQSGSNDRYSGIYANLSGIANCETYVAQTTNDTSVGIAQAVARKGLTPEQAAQARSPTAMTEAKEAAQAIISARNPNTPDGTPQKPVAVQSTLSAKGGSQPAGATVPSSPATKKGPPVIPASGRVALVMKTDSGEVLNRFDLSAVLAAPGQEVVLSGDASGNAKISAIAIANPVVSGAVAVTLELTSKDQLQKVALVISPRVEPAGTDIGEWRLEYELLDRSALGDFFRTVVHLTVTTSPSQLPPDFRNEVLKMAAGGLSSGQTAYVMGPLTAAARSQLTARHPEELKDALLGLFR